MNGEQLVDDPDALREMQALYAAARFLMHQFPGLDFKAAVRIALTVVARYENR